MKQKTNGREPPGSEEEQRIIRDCVKAAAAIETLAGKACRFLNRSNEFIFRCDKGGFVGYYREPGSLKRDIPANQKRGRRDNFRPGERGYE